MPQLFSRMDESNWLTPSIADILDQGAAPPGGDGTIREQMLILQNELGELETPARIVNVRPTPSYTLFIVQPETVGRLGSRRTVTFAEIRKSVAQIAERHKEWRLGFMPQVEDMPDTCGIMLRTEHHRPLSLRRLLVRGPFRDHPSNLAFTLGITLDQKLIVRDLQNLRNLIIVGEGNARQHCISSVVLTLTLLNTPGEIRLLLLGEGAAQYKGLTETPHALAPYSADSETIIQTFEQLTQEAQTRLDAFYEEGVNVFESFNARQRESNKAQMPRILVVLDSLADPALQPLSERLVPVVRDLLLNGPEVGIHLILTASAPNALPEALTGLHRTQIFMRSVAPEIGDKLKNFHNSMLRFIDAMIVEDSGLSVIPVELCAISSEEIQGAVLYWQQMANKRAQENPDSERPAAVSAPVVHQVALPMAESTTERAAMLAAYLGWLSVGALRDIFGLQESEAATVIQHLQQKGVVETNSGGGMFRFMRLADAPTAE